MRDKFGEARVHAIDADLVSPPLVAECPVSLESRVIAVHPLGRAGDPGEAELLAVEFEIVRVHVHEGIRSSTGETRIDPERWRPLIMSFQRYFGLGDEVQKSRLSSIDEEWYRK